MPLSFLTAELLAKSKSSSSGSSSSSLIFLVVIIGFFALYFLVLRPRTRRARQPSRGGTTLSVGDEVVSAGGILGTITAIAGDEIVVEVSPGVTLTFWRRAVNLRSSVPGAPQSGAPSVPSYPDEPYTDESYTDESYVDPAPHPEASYGEDADGEDGDGGAEMTEADHRDSSGGPGEGR